MAETVINGRDGTADFTIAGTSYRSILDAIELREMVELTNSDTFAIEGVADQDPGRTQLAFTISGLGKKGSTPSGPIDAISVQNVAIVATMSTGCTYSFFANFSESAFTRVANSNSRISARGLSKGTYTKVWQKT